LATVGYGDIHGISIPEKIVCIFSMLLGASVFAYMMGAMASVVSAMNTTQNR
jgi:hypothetical protein